MRTARKATVFVAIAAIVLNCVAPQYATAAHHPAPAEAAVVDHSSHATSHHGHDATSDPRSGDGADNAGNTFKYCCAAICMVSAYMVDAPMFLTTPVATRSIVAILEDEMRPINPAAIDPPPRSL